MGGLSHAGVRGVSRRHVRPILGFGGTPHSRHGQRTGLGTHVVSDGALRSSGSDFEAWATPRGPRHPLPVGALAQSPRLDIAQRLLFLESHYKNGQAMRAWDSPPLSSLVLVVLPQNCGVRPLPVPCRHSCPDPRLDPHSPAVRLPRLAWRRLEVRSYPRDLVEPIPSLLISAFTGAHLTSRTTALKMGRSARPELRVDGCSHL